MSDDWRIRRTAMLATLAPAIAPDAAGDYVMVERPVLRRIARLLHEAEPPGPRPADAPPSAHEAVRYMYPERYRPMPPEAGALLHLADRICAAACEISNQREPAEPWGDVPFERSPAWAYENLSEALNAYHDARHSPRPGDGRNRNEEGGT